MQKWEDDTRHIRPPIQSKSKTPDSSPAMKGRDSVAELAKLPVSARRERWEKLMADRTLPKPVYSWTKSVSANAKSPLKPINRDLTYMSQAERDRLERKRELEELRSRKIKLKELTHRETPMEHDLPPPPPPPPAQEHNDHHDLPLPEAPPSPLRQAETPSGNSTCVDIVADSASGMKSSVKHDYFSRPKLRNSRGDDSGDVEAPMTRQRSVTFQAAPGTAPGDSSAPETETESEPVVLLPVSSFARKKKTPVQHRADVKSLLDSSPKSLTSEESDEVEELSSSPNGGGGVDDDTSADGEFDDLLDTALETAASTGAEGLPTGPESSNEESPGDDFIHSDPECNTATPHSHRSLNRKSATPGQLLRHASVHRKSSGGMSRETDALVDLCTPGLGRKSSSRRGKPDLATTPIRSQHGGQSGTPRRGAAGTMESLEEHEWRVTRFNEIQQLLAEEKQAVFRASQALQKCFEVGSEGSSSLSIKHTPLGKLSKRKRQCLQQGVGSHAHIEICTDLLLACQRQQALMEESAVLYDKSCPVHMPPGNDALIRARLLIPAVRLHLKSTNGGFALLDGSNEARFVQHSNDRLLRYHLIALMKSHREGRVFRSKVATIMHLNDALAICGRIQPATHIDLSTNLDLKPLRSDFAISVEVYCLAVGSESKVTLQERLVPGGVSTTSFGTPAAKTGKTPRLLTSASQRWKRVVHGSAALSDESPSQPQSCGLLSNLMHTPSQWHLDSSKSHRDSPMSAFVLLSSCVLRHDDKLLSSNQRKEQETDYQLHLPRLPRGCPLLGPLDLVGASVRLATRVLRRGFLTMFEEVGGLALWQRYWCQLCVDKLIMFRSPEDEAAWRQDQTAAGPVAQIDFRQISNPWAVAAPRRICARTNTIYMRSLRPATAELLVQHPRGLVSADSESLLFRASGDFSWFEQKHLLCADSAAEMNWWMDLLNKCIAQMQDWMPQHFDLLTRYDASLEFTEPVSSKLSACLLRSGQ